MYYILLTAQQAATQAASAAQEATTQAPSNDIIGIGGIIATLLVGIVIYEATGKIDDEKDQMSKPEIRKEVCFILQSSK